MKLRKWLSLVCGIFLLFSSSCHHVAPSDSASESNSPVSASAGSASPEVSISSPLEQTFLVRFYNEDVLLETDSVAQGANAVYRGNEPKKEDDEQNTYSFSGWDKSLNHIVADTDFHALFSSEAREYQIRFINDDDSFTVLETFSLSYGETPSFTGTPTKPNTPAKKYVFSHWMPQIVPVTEDADYYASYSEETCSYHIRFLNDDQTVLQDSYWDFGKVPTYSGKTPEKASTSLYTYSFSGWDKNIVAVSEDRDYTAVYLQQDRYYIIRFLNDDSEHTVLQSSLWKYGAMPEYTGPAPTKPDSVSETYAFGSWGEILPVTGDKDYVAQYNEGFRTYTITFADDTGKVLETQHLQYNETPVYGGETPTKATTDSTVYTFSGWTPAIADVTADATYTATYTETPRTYTVTFENEDGTTFATQTVGYGSYPTFPSDHPTKSLASPTTYDYEFSHWNPETPAMVTGNQTYKPVFVATVIFYTITFKNYDGSILETVSNLIYGDLPQYTKTKPVKPEDITYRQYTFKEWSPAITKVTGNQTYTATFTGSNLKTYTAQFTSTANHASLNNFSSYNKTTDVSCADENGVVLNNDYGAYLGYYFFRDLSDSSTTINNTDAVANIKVTSGTVGFFVCFYIAKGGVFDAVGMDFAFSSTGGVTGSSCQCLGNTDDNWGTTVVPIKEAKTTATGSESSFSSTLLVDSASALATYRAIYFHFTATSYTQDVTLTISLAAFTFHYQ